MFEYIGKKKNSIRKRISKIYYHYGLWCASHPLPIIITSVTVIIFCSLPLLSLPVFERLMAFLFQRIRVDYKTEVKLETVNSIERTKVYAYVQQINITCSISNISESLNDHLIIQRMLQMDAIKRLHTYLSLPQTEWSNVCLKLERAKPSLSALVKRIKYTRSWAHQAIKHMKHHDEGCLYVSPSQLFEQSNPFAQSSIPFQDLVTSLHHSKKVLLRNNTPGQAIEISFIVTLFLKNHDQRFISHLQRLLPGRLSRGNTQTRNALRIHYQFAENSGPAELIPLSIAYVVVFLYLWFTVAKLDLIRTRWGLAFAAVVSFICSLTMAIGICASLDILPTTVNVGEIFPYVVIVIGLENFWIITKAVMSTRKLPEVKYRVAEGLANEGYYITKNLIVEMCLLGAGYFSGIKAIKEFSIFAFVGYWTDFFLQLMFYLPILAVDTRRATLSECVSIRQSLEYGFFNTPVPDPGAAPTIVVPAPAPMPLSLKFLYIVARFRIVQRSIMIFTVIYFYHMIFLSLHHGDSSQKPPLQTAKMPFEIMPTFPNSLRCLTEEEIFNIQHVPPWQMMCLKHWPELLNYFFVHLNDSSLIVLPSIDFSVAMNDTSLNQPDASLQYSISWSIVSIVILTSIGIVILVVKVICECLQDHGIHIPVIQDSLEYKQSVLECSSFQNNYIITNMTYSREDDRLACAYVNGDIFVWDLYDERCTMYVDRRNMKVCDLVHIPPNNLKEPPPRDEPIPSSIWALDFKFQTLALACNHGRIEVYSLERFGTENDIHATASAKGQRLLCVYQAMHNFGYTHLRIVSSSKFVVAREDGCIEMFSITNCSQTDLNGFTFCCVLSANVYPFPKREYIKVLKVGMERIYVVNIAGELKILQLSDADHQCLSIETDMKNITATHLEHSPERIIIGGAHGCTQIITISGLCEHTLHSIAGYEIESVCSSDKYIAALNSNGLIVIWSTNDYSEHCRIEPIKGEHVQDIVFLPQHTLAAISKTCVVLIHVTDNTVLETIQYSCPPGADTQCPVILGHQSLLLCRSMSVVLLKFKNLTDRDR